ncbi:MAG TPA: gamma-glutamyl-phosphate reductase, partial [Shewanella frigidimarina]|nr:gamma-glutamyl-phosphate reductase [Shewanella frigidimarina]
MSLIKDLSQAAATAAQTLALLDEKVKNTILVDMARALRAHSDDIIKANLLDLDHAEKAELGAAMIDRLT